MKAIILAAGRGSRLGVHTELLPKGCLTLGGMSLIERQIKSLRWAGIDEIAIVTGYLAEAFSDFQLKTFHNPNWARTNMVSSLLCAREWLDHASCLITYADILYDAKLIQEIQQFKKSPLLLPVNLQWRELWQARFDNPLEDLESLRLSESGRLLEIGQKVSSLDQPDGQFMGLMMTEPTGWQEIEHYLNSLDHKIQAQLDMTALLQGMIKQGAQIDIYKSNYDWIEVDDSDDLNLYHEWCSVGRLSAIFHD